MENVKGLDKRVFNEDISLKKGYFLVLQVSVFFKKGVFFSFVNISERGIFLNLENDHTYLFCMRVARPGPNLSLPRRSLT